MNQIFARGNRLLVGGLFLAVLGLAPSIAGASGLTYNSSSSRSGASYSFPSSSQIELQVDHICNPTSAARNVTLVMFVNHASTASGGSGHYVATDYVGALPANACFNNIDDVVAFATPPDGSYNVHLLVEEGTSNAGQYDDSIDFTNPMTIGDTGGDGGGSGSIVLGNVNANVDYRAETVELFVDSIRNDSSSTTGTLRIELWFFDSPFTGSAQSGYRMASYQIGTNNGQLQPGSTFVNISATRDFLNHPPAGYYFGTLFVQEFQSGCTSPDHFCNVDYVNFDDYFTVPAPVDPIDPLIQSAGGSFSSNLLLILAIALSLRLMWRSRRPGGVL
jgi:hypothetical protein